MRHDDYNVLGAGDEVHRAAHAFYHLARNHVVGEVAIDGDLEPAEDGDINVSTPYHGETVGAAKEGRAGDGGNRLLACVDKVGVNFVLRWERTDSEQPILGLEDNLSALGDMVGDEGRHSDAEVDIGAVPQFERRSSDNDFSGIHCCGYYSMWAEPASGKRLNGYTP